MTFSTDLHCNFLTARLDPLDPETSITFRVGMPTDWERAIRFHQEVDAQLAAGEIVQVRYGARYYRVRFAEVRSVDRHGIGLGSQRHRSRRYASEVHLPRWGTDLLPPRTLALTWSECVDMLSGS